MVPKLQVFQRDQAAEAVKSALSVADNAGVPVHQIKHLVNGTLGFACPKGDFGKVLFTAHAKRVGDKYYAMGTGPKKERPAEEGSSTGRESQPLQLEGELQVTVKGSGYNIRAKARKVVLIFSVVTTILTGIALTKPV